MSIDVVDFIRMNGGSFAIALANAWLVADQSNREKIESCFADMLRPYVQACGV